MAAKPPQISPDRLEGVGVVAVVMVMSLSLQVALCLGRTRHQDVGTLFWLGYPRPIAAWNRWPVVRLSSSPIDRFIESRDIQNHV
jgi:hypothetical protein